MRESGPAADAGVPGCGSGLDGASAAELVERVRRNEAGAIQELYAVLVQFSRYQFRREVERAEQNDRVHDLFLSVLDSIKQDELRDPRSLMGFVRTLGRRQAAQHIKSAMRLRRRQREAPLWPHRERPPGPEERLLERERSMLVEKALARVSELQREVLVRFYLLGQSKERICREMNLSQTQFRLVKTRAKAACERAGRMLMTGAWLRGRSWSGPGCPSGGL